jgi:nicotinamide mononucleotide transporter
MHWLNHLLTEFYNAQWHVTKTQAIYYREIVGNVFGLGSALFGLARNVWAWPVGIVGNVLLFTVFLGQALGNGQGTPLYGQASRQVFFVITRTGTPGRAHRPSVHAGPRPANAACSSRRRWWRCWSAS